MYSVKIESWNVFQDLVIYFGGEQNKQCITSTPVTGLLTTCVSGQLYSETDECHKTVRGKNEMVGFQFVAFIQT